MNRRVLRNWMMAAAMAAVFGTGLQVNAYGFRTAYDEAESTLKPLGTGPGGSPATVNGRMQSTPGGHVLRGYSAFSRLFC